MTPVDSMPLSVEKEPMAVSVNVADEDRRFDALNVAGMRFEWYRDGFRMLLLLLLIMASGLALSLGLNVYLFNAQPGPKYFVQTKDHQLVGVVPLNEPSFSDERITQWVTEAVIAANNWNFADYRESLQDACNRYFTPQGCQEYKDALVRIGNLESVKKKRLTVRAVVTRPPIILNKVISGQTQRFTWNMQMEMMVSYLSSSEQTTQTLMVNLVIVRRAVTEYEQGVGIEKYVAQGAARGGSL